MSYQYWGDTRQERRRRRRMRQILSLVKMGTLIVLLVIFLIMGSMFAAQINQDNNVVDRSVDKNSMNSFGGSTYTYTIGN